MKKFTGLLVVLLILFSVPINVYAASGVNNGNAYDDPFGNSGISSSFGGDAKYYDFYVPYNMTIKEIGGYATGVSYEDDSKYKSWGDSVIPNESDLAKHTYNLNRQGSKGSTWLGLDVKIDSNTGFEYVEKNSCKFYIASIGKCLFNYSALKDEGFLEWSLLSQTGILYDIILKDGTIIHFATGDGMGTYHSINDSSDSVTSNGQDGVNVTFSTLIKKQYKNLYHALKPNHLLECFCETGALDKFISYYKISESNPIMYIRMYNKSLKDGNFTVNSGFGELTTTADTKNLNFNSSQYMNGYYSEMDLGTWNKLTEQNIQADLLDNANRDNLDSNELNNLINWENNIEQDSQEGGFVYWARRIVSIFGIILIIWIILIYIAYWFDKLNNIVDIDLLLVLTFGRLRVSDTEDNCTFSMKDMAKTGTRTVNHRAILLICVVGITFGVLVVSGVLYKILSKLVYAVLNFLS